MKRKIIWLVASCVTVASLLLVSCTPTATEEDGVAPPAEDLTEEQEEVSPTPTSGHLEGRVLYRCNKQPANKYYVYLFPGSKGSAIAMNIRQVDENGAYRFTNLEAGFYRMTAHREPDIKGLTYIHAKVEVIAKVTTIAEDILLPFCPDLKLTSPADGANVTTNRPTFTWESYAVAVAYQVHVQAESGTLYHFPPYPPGTNENDATALEDLLPGNYEWYISAYDDISKLTPLGESCKWHFSVVSP